MKTREYLINIAIISAVFLVSVIGYKIAVNKPVAVTDSVEVSEKVILGGESGPIYDLIGSSSSPYYVATSTATTTQAVQLGDQYDQVTVNLQYNASSTASDVRWQYEFCDQSTTNNCSDSGAFWFAEATYSCAGSTCTYQSASTTRVWAGPTGEHGLQADVLNVNHEWMRVRMFRGKKYENGSVYMYLKPKRTSTNR